MITEHVTQFFLQGSDLLAKMKSFFKLLNRVFPKGRGVRHKNHLFPAPRAVNNSGRRPLEERC